MPLITTEKLDRAKEILKKKSGFLICSVCGSKSVKLLPRVFSVPDVPGVSTPYSRIHPGPFNSDRDEVVWIDLMFTTCKNCGHVDFFNAHQLEVFGEEEEKKKDVNVGVTTGKEIVDISNVDSELLKALRIACPMYMWAFHNGRFSSLSETREKFYSREEVIAILIRERREMQARVELIQKALDFLESESTK